MSTCTVVTCYYRFASKHRDDEYDAWIARFLGAVDSPMVIFCEAEMAPRLRGMRARVASQTRVVVLPLASTECADMVDWDGQHARDPERDTQTHSPSLYTVWNGKSAFVGRAMAMDPFGTDAFAWCDIGCFRSDQHIERYRRWPEGARLDALDPDRLAMGCIAPFAPGDLVLSPATGLPPTFERVVHMAGAIMVGYRRAWERYIPVYFATLHRMTAAGMFVGMDQNVMATVVVTRPDLVTVVHPTFLPAHGDPWFFLQSWFSDVCAEYAN